MAKALDEACMRALAINRVPSYKTVKTILSRMETNDRDLFSDKNEFAYLRGAGYFENKGGE